MPVSIDICNQALSLVGAGRVTGVDESTLEGSQCKLHYLPVLRHMLTAREWSFATKRRELAESTVAPAFGYSKSFTLPADCLKVRVCTDASGYQFTDWVVEGKSISLNEAVCFIEYTSYEQDASVYPGPFEQCFVHLLASRLAVPLMQSNSLKETHFAMYERLMSEASGLDGSQGSPRRIGLRASRLVDVRSR